MTFVYIPVEFLIWTLINSDNSLISAYLQIAYIVYECEAEGQINTP